MTITHLSVKVAGQKLFAVADWNAAHVGTATPDAHGNALHTSVFITAADVPANETDPVFTAWKPTYNAHDHSAGDPTQVDHANLANVTTDQHHAKLHALDSTTEHSIGSLTNTYLVKNDGTKLVNATNTDAQVSAAVTASHAKQHSITSTSDHTSTATSGKMLKADANGLPINATNTDAQVSAAVTASHAAATVNGLPLTIAGQDIKFNYDTNDFQLSGNNLQIKDGGIDHGGLAGLGDDDHTQYLLRQPAADVVINESGGDFNIRIEGDTDANLFFLDAGLERIGIGTASPGEKLEVNGNIRNVKLVLHDNGLEEWYTNANSNIAINYYGYAGGTTQYRDFYVCNGKAGTILSAIGSTGKVGIGTTSPNYALTIQHANSPFFFQTAPIGSGIQGFIYLDSGIGIGFGSYSQHPLTFWTNNTEQVRITTAGAVGIGTASPGYKLDVNGTGHFANLLTLDSASYDDQLLISRGGNGYYLAQSSTSGLIEAYGSTAAFKIFDPALVVLTTGRVNIGGALTYSGVLNVVGGVNVAGTTYATAKFVQDNTNAKGIALGYDTASQTGVIMADTLSAGSNIAFWTYSGSAWLERMRLESTGQLDVYTNKIRFYSASDNFAIYCNNNINLQLDSANGPVYISSALTVAGAGNSSLAGNVGVGTTSPTISDGTGLHIAGKILRIGTAKTPPSSATTGNQGEFCWDDTYLYVHGSTVWKRVAVTSF